MDVEKGSSGDWSETYVAPLRNLDAALLLVAECVKVAEPGADPTTRAGELGATLRQLSELFVEVDDDLPHTYRDGIPFEEADPSTTSSVSS